MNYLDKSAPPIPTVPDENHQNEEHEFTRLHVISHILPRFPVRHGRISCEIDRSKDFVFFRYTQTKTKTIIEEENPRREK